MTQDVQASDLKLVIGNKNYSSWSLRAWLLLKQFQIPFQEVKVLLSLPDTKAELAEWSPSLKVPVLAHNHLRIWDTLAIAEYVSETFLDGRGWPGDAEARALARSVSAEMHSSFSNLRMELPMNCRRPPATHPVSQACLAEIQRIQQIWEQCRHEFGQRGPWLFGQFSIADAMYAPVVMRFATYRVELGNVAQAYCDTHLQNPHLKDWVAAGCKEPEVIEADEV